MGVDYYLINKEKKTFFELGKGNWYDLNGESFDSAEYLKLCILYDVYGLDEDSQSHAADLDKLSQSTDKLVPKLMDVAAGSPADKLVIVGDYGDDITVIKSFGYRCLGTRYPLGWSYETPEEQLADLNKHLTTDRRLYNYGWNDTPEWLEKYGPPTNGF